MVRIKSKMDTLLSKGQAVPLPGYLGATDDDDAKDKGPTTNCRYKLDTKTKKCQTGRTEKMEAECRV